MKCSILLCALLLISAAAYYAAVDEVDGIRQARCITIMHNGACALAENVSCFVHPRRGNGLAYIANAQGENAEIRLDPSHFGTISSIVLSNHADGTQELDLHCRSHDGDHTYAIRCDDAGMMEEIAPEKHAGPPSR